MFVIGKKTTGIGALAVLLSCGSSFVYGQTEITPPPPPVEEEVPAAPEAAAPEAAPAVEAAAPEAAPEAAPAVEAAAPEAAPEAAPAVEATAPEAAPEAIAPEAAPAVEATTPEAAPEVAPVVETAAPVAPADVVLVEGNYMMGNVKKCPKIADILADSAMLAKLGGAGDTKILKSKSTVEKRNNYLEEVMSVTFDFDGKTWAARPADKYKGAIAADLEAMKTKVTVTGATNGCEYGTGNPTRKALLIRQVSPTN